LGANVLVEFQVFLIGGIFFKLGAKNFNNWGHFFKKLGAMGQMC